MITQIGSYDIIVPELKEGFQALHAIYSRRCLPAIKKMIQSDNLKISALYKTIHALKIPENTITPFNRNGRLFLNINTPNDLQACQK